MLLKGVPALGLAMIALATAVPGLARVDAALDNVSSVANTDCELHVWPAERFNSMTTGWLGGGLLDAAVHADKDKSNRTQLASALDPQGQLDALAALHLTELLKAKPAKLVLHPDALDRKTINKIAARRADSASGCYSELIVADVFYQKAAIYGRSLRTLFMYRDFGQTKANPRIYKAWGGNGLKLFPPKEGEDVTAANEELTTVFKANFEEFARNASAKLASN